MTELTLRCPTGSLYEDVWKAVEAVNRKADLFSVARELLWLNRRRDLAQLCKDFSGHATWHGCESLVERAIQKRDIRHVAMLCRSMAQHITDWKRLRQQVPHGYESMAVFLQVMHQKTAAAR